MPNFGRSTVGTEAQNSKAQCGSGPTTSKCRVSPDKFQSLAPRVVDAGDFFAISNQAERLWASGGAAPDEALIRKSVDALYKSAFKLQHVQRKKGELRRDAPLRPSDAQKVLQMAARNVYK